MSEAPKNSNYTPEQLVQVIAMYDELGNDGLEKIAEHFNRSVRSIRSKLVHAGVYRVSSKTTTRKDGEPAKKELLRAIEATGFDASGFEGATKVALSRLLGLVSH